jgi:hypothetical protein
MNISNILTTIGSAATSLGSAFSGTSGMVVVGIGSAFTLVGDLVSLGVDPATHLEKLRDLHPDLQRIQDEREAARQQKIKSSVKP